MYIIWFKNVNVIYIYVYIKSTIWKPRISGIRELFRFRSDRVSTFPFFLRFYHWETVWSIYIRILKGSRSGILRTGTKIWLGRRNPSYHERYTDEVLDLQQLVIVINDIFHSDIFPLLTLLTQKQEKVRIIRSVSSYFAYFCLVLSNSLSF